MRLDGKNVVITGAGSGIGRAACDVFAAAGAKVLGIPATGREVEVDHVEMWRVRDGRIVEHWGGMGVAGQLHRELTK